MKLTWSNPRNDGARQAMHHNHGHTKYENLHYVLFDWVRPKIQVAPPV